MNVLITGSNGLLGQKIIHRLNGNPDFLVFATGRGECRIQNIGKNVTYVTLDISSAEFTEKCIKQIMPDVVIHTAAMTNVDDCELNPEECEKQNVGAVKNVIEACEATGAHLIHLSTDFIFDGSAGPYREEDEPNPISVYGQSKFRAEQLVMKASCPWAIVRTILVYGIAPGLSRSNIILWVKASLEQGKEIQVVDDQFRTPTLAEDLAAGCLLIAEKKACGIFNIAGKDFLTPYEMALQTADYFGLNRQLIRKATAATFTQPARRPPRTGLSITKAREKLGYEPHSFLEGIRVLSEQIHS
jgi:dTDP-4-dehydrorhamnose reductase